MRLTLKEAIVIPAFILLFFIVTIVAEAKIVDPSCTRVYVIVECGEKLCLKFLEYRC